MKSKRRKKVPPLSKAHVRQPKTPIKISEALSRIESTDDRWFAAIHTEAMKEWDSPEDNEAFKDLKIIT